MNTQNKKQNIIIFIFGVGTILYSISLKGNEAWGLSPALFCIVCGIAITISAFFIKGSNVKYPEKPLQLVAFLLASFLYSLVLSRVDFLIITPIFLAAIIRLFFKKNILDVIIFAISFSVILKVIFSLGFGIRL